ncbi:ion transporter [Candidatus Woesearchaeota archaeon]|nr:ion transporter [Candidatus Woesearchaeota archaeon]
MDIQKLGTYFFIVGVLIAIFSGAFAISADMQIIALLMLIITGSFVGLLNIDEEREMHFLVAAGVFIIAAQALEHYRVLAGLELLSDFSTMLTNLIIFSSSAGIVVGLKLIFHYSSYKEKKQYDDEPEFTDPQTETVWNVIIFIAVCLAFVIFILEVFFYTNGLTAVLTYISWVVLAVFAVDLGILISKAKGFWHFIKHHWPDIISVIPVYGVFQLLKVVRVLRVARIARVMQSGGRLSRVSKISHSTKFFSKESGFNKYMKKKKR